MRLTAPALNLLALGLLLGCSSRAETPPLPKLQIDANRVATVGLSSGAYMATQVHFALSDRVHGAALIAGGPYGCAGGDLDTALSTCMSATEGAPDAAALLQQLRERAAAGTLPSLDHLDDDRVFVLHGGADDKVSPQVGAAAAELYRGLAAEAPGLSLTARLDGPFGHLLPQAGEGGECAVSQAPFLARCGLDAAGEVFAALYGPAPSAPAEATGELRSFDQSALIGEGPDPVLAEVGYLYVPQQCRDQDCGLLIAFHGCQQNADKVGSAFVAEAGFNRWADVHGVAVLYPQTRASFAPLNPNACWDWWGYTGADYDLRSGAQVQWLARTLDALGLGAAD